MTTQEHAQKIKDICLQHTKFLMHLHPSPDADSYGSTVALAKVLSDLGKNVTVISGDSKFPDMLACLPLSHMVTHATLSDVNIADFDCVLALDSSKPQMISRTFDGIFPQGVEVIVIDHHASNVGYGTYNWIDATYAACAHMVFDLIQAWGISPSEEIATILFIGMYTDTGGFKYTSTTSATLKAGAVCREYAPNLPLTVSIFEQQLTLHDIKFQALALQSTTVYAGGKVVAGFVSHAELEQNGIPDEYVSASYISGALRSIKGIYVSVGLVEEGHNTIKVSMRSYDGKKYDVSKVAVELGGGGHVAASGCVLEMTMDEARDLVISKLITLVEGIA